MYFRKMDRLYIPDYNQIFRKLSRMSSGDFPRLPGLKYDDMMMKNGPKSNQKKLFFEIDRDPWESIGGNLKLVKHGIKIMNKNNDSRVHPQLSDFGKGRRPVDLYERDQHST